MEQQHAGWGAIIGEPPVKRHDGRRSAGRATRNRSNRTGAARLSRDLAAVRAERDAAFKSARRRSDFISHASHEIRTPLHSIAGYSTLLLGTQLTNEQRGFAQALRTGIDSLLAVVTDVLDLSQLDAGAMRLDDVAFDLTRLVHGVSEMWREAADAKGLTLRVDTVGISRPHLVGDPGRIRQVLNNLVNNAIKFTNTGEVLLRAETVRGRSGFVTVHIAVIDSGAGIGRNQRNRLFQPFSRLGRQTSSRSGAGLGLAISKQLAELMGGTLQARSAGGTGSTFSLRLRIREDPTPASIREVEQLDLGSLRVYLADDDTRSRDELFLSLAGIGISVAWSGPAHGLPEAMRTAIEAGLSTDIAIVGHVEQEGVDLAIAHTCRTDPRLVPTPLVLTPISGVRGYAREAREAGYSAYLPRPFHGNELSLCIRAVAAHSPPRSDDTRFVTRHSAAESPQLIRRVLLADDDPAGRRVTRLQIERLGFTVDEVPGGAEAITAASGGAYDLILMDCQMPDVNGLAAATAIRTQEAPGRRAFIVALSADVRAELREACWRAGVDEFLEKPLRTETLVRVLNAMTGLPELTRGGGHDGRSSDDVDLGALNALMADIGAEMTLDLLREYLANAERAVEQLTGSGQPDAGYVGREAHRLVGGARALGLRRLDHLWEELSTSATGGGDHRTIVEELRRACWNLGRWMDARQGKLYA